MLRSLTLRASLLLLAAAFAAPVPAARADPGVGVTLGRIDIDDKLTPGGGYRLPSLGVVNVGSSTAEYEVEITYLQDQPRRRPPAGWFELQPRRFTLAAGETQTVRVRILLPPRADPGDYAAYIEARPVVSGEGVTIGVAAATSVTFSVQPAGWLHALQVRVNRGLDEVYPWPYVAAGTLLLTLVYLRLRRYFRLRLPFERR